MLHDQKVRGGNDPIDSIQGGRASTCISLLLLEGIGFMAKKDLFRVVTRASDGSLKIRDFHSAEMIFKTHSQVGVDDSSTDLDLRGMPVFRGLIGPIPEGKNIARYESPEVFEMMTKEWAAIRPRRRRRRSVAEETESTVSSDAISAN
jgi:hypothetical protein